MKNFPPILLGNWKMNFLKKDAETFFNEFLPLISSISLGEQACVGFATPYTLLDYVGKKLSKDQNKGANSLMLGSQNVHWAQSGAHTGEISASMLLDSGVDFCVIGHSERRSLYGETSQNVAKRSIAAIENCLLPVICVGESQEEYEKGLSEKIVLTQLEESLNGIKLSTDSKKVPELIIAYEPVWAIGTGLSAKPEEAGKMCEIIQNFIKETFAKELPVLYGGSANEDNVLDLYSQESIHGFLVGGASLKPKSFITMISNCIS